MSRTIFIFKKCEESGRIENNLAPCFLDQRGVDQPKKPGDLSGGKPPGIKTPLLRKQDFLAIPCYA